jgi:acetyl-CoA carboxylase biotin carboxyl carrier protein
MNLDELKKILELVREHQLSEFEIEHEGLRLKVRKDQASGAVVSVTEPAPMPMVAPMPIAAGVAAAAAAAAGDGPTAASGDGEPEIELAVVKSPIVGTFYRAPEPGAADFVEIGSTVKKGQVLCIIEAMKLMNEIESDRDGEVAAVYVENGQPVQFGDRLFALKVS